MPVVATLRHLRHGPLKRLGPVWTALGDLYRTGLRVTGASRPTAHRIGGYGPFLLHGEFTFSDFEHWGRGHNRGFASCIEACRGKRCVVDVGAHIGLVTLPMSSVIADGGCVYAFEPAAANLERLREHLAFNDVRNVESVDALVGADDRDAVLFFEQRRAAGQNSIVVKKNPESYFATRRRQISLDGFCGARGIAPEVIKIDVEGGEIGVLEGGRDTFGRRRPLIFLSVHPAKLGLLGRTADELAGLIDDLGYDCRDVDGNAVESFRLDEYVLTPRQQ